MTRKLQGSYKGNVGELVGNIYLNPARKDTRRYRRKILEVRPGLLKDDYSDITGKIMAPVQLAIDHRLDMISEMRKTEDRLKGKQTSITEGFVYLVKNEAFPGWIKAGMTIDYENRLATYNMYSPTNSFEMIGIKWVADRKLCETILLEELGKISQTTKGEWFKIDETLALRVFDS